MEQYRGRYKTAHLICNILEFSAWVVVVVGVIVALAGMASGGFLGSLVGGSPPVVLRFFAMLPGLGICIGGLVLVLYVQQYRATTDVAEMTREMLHIARQSARQEQSDNVGSEPSLGPRMSTTSKPNGDAKAILEPVPTGTDGVPNNASAAYRYMGKVFYKSGRDWFIEGNDTPFVSADVAKNVIRRDDW